MNTLQRYEAVTQGILVAVTPVYLEDQSSPDDNEFFWAYEVEIENKSQINVQLIERHWEITDANGKQEHVNGPGVVGEQPLLYPGDRFQYTSGCPLSTPSGFMSGHYTMVDDDGSAMEITIPAFALDLPDHFYSVN